MRRIGDPSFFRIIDRFIGIAPGADRPGKGSIDGVGIHHERHSYGGETYGFALEVTTLSALAKPAWTLLIVKQYWWGKSREDRVNAHQWAHVSAGRRADVVAWLKRQEGLDR